MPAFCQWLIYDFEPAQELSVKQINCIPRNYIIATFSDSDESLIPTHGNTIKKPRIIQPINIVGNSHKQVTNKELQRLL